MKLINLTGQIFGRLLVAGRAPTGSSKRTIYYCWCACGESCKIESRNMRKGLTKSCGCLHREMMSARLTKDFPAERKMWLRARFRAGLAGLPFTITLADIKIPDRCPVLGIILHKTKRSESRDSAPTLDRIENEKGYIPGNVAVISSRANRIKNNSTPQELAAVLRYALRGESHGGL